MKLIPLSKTGKNAGKYFAQVDDEDYEYLMQFNWCVSIRNNTNYAVSSKKIEVNAIKKRFPMQSVITKSLLLIDHIDRNGLNNQKNNLREATKSQNGMNKNPYGSSKYLGVCLYRYRKKKFLKKSQIIKYYYPTRIRWVAKINIHGRSQHLGIFTTEEAAALAYNEAAKKYHGEFANLNVIE